MKRLFVDTSAWFAHINRADPDHAAVGSALRGFAGRIVISNFVFDETVTLCRYRLGFPTAVKIGQVLLDQTKVDMVRVTAEDEQAAWRLFLKREDQVYSFTDCTSFVLVRRLGIDLILAADADFRREGFQTIAL